jgi:hypothetical protein
MPIDTEHPLYTAKLPAWKRCRDAYDGEDAVKGAGQDYLPKIDPTQTAGEYIAYLLRAMYYEAVGRTIAGFVGAIARKAHTITLPEALADFEDDATASGMGAAELVKSLCAETLLIGRSGILVDFDDAQQRAYLALYCAEAITNWGTDRVVLRETLFDTDPKDHYAVVEIEQFRELHLDGGRYTVTIWREQATADSRREWAIYSEVVPHLRGKPLDALPWFWLSSMGRTEAIPKPPLLGLVNVALSHYRSSADLEHGRHFTGLPTLWVSGAAADGEPIRIGSGAVIQLADPGARAGYAEFTGQGLGSLERALETKEHQMAQLGAAVLGHHRKGVEAAETARIRVAGESSLLMGVVSAVEETLLAALECCAAWMGVKGGIEIKINRDFVDQQLDPQTLTALVASYQAGAIDLPTFLYNLDQAEMLQPETDIDELAATLKAAADKKSADAAAAAKAAAAAQPRFAHSDRRSGQPLWER